MNFLLWLLMGAVAGWLASVVMKTDNSQGTLGDIVLGIVGAIVGGFVMNMFGEPGATGFNLYSLAVATGGAVLLIWIGRMIQRSA